MTFVGLDLHKRYITACALSDAGDVLAEARRLPVSIDALRDFLAPFRDPISVAMEATLYWQWLHDQLEALGHTARVADARQVKLIWQTRSKTDPIDARKLAELLRVNLFDMDPRSRHSPSPATPPWSRVSRETVDTDQESHPWPAHNRESAISAH
jgi:transposase